MSSGTFWKIENIIEENKHNVKSLRKTIRKRVKNELLALHHKMPPKHVVTCAPAQSSEVKSSTQIIVFQIPRELAAVQSGSVDCKM